MRLIPRSSMEERLSKSTNYQERYRMKWIDRISDVDQTVWDALALPLETPFLEYAWLHRMEASGSVSSRTGWHPRHLTVWSGNTLAAAAPLYIKEHSEGEFVFDYAWADVAYRLGIGYYPKLVGMSPATPTIGYRFLTAPDADEVLLTEMMVREIDRFCLRESLSGCSFLYVDPLWGRRMTRAGFLGWRHQSYNWINPGFGSFDDYLAVFKTNQRRNIRRERNAVRRRGITMKIVTGETVPEEFFSLMYRYYARTNDKFGMWGCKYLNRAFFEGLSGTYRHRLLFVAAFDDPHRSPLGMSFLVTKGDRLYGRYWGSEHYVDSLHFNVCFYQPIEWAIANGVRVYDPGVGSEHKLRRGFQAVPNYSLHRFHHDRLRQLMARHIDEINAREQRQIDALNRQLPFAQT